MTTPHDSLNAGERARLRALHSKIEPPEALEGATLSRLRTEGLLMPAGATRGPCESARRTPSLFWIAAAAALAFVVGYWIGSPEVPAPSAATATRSFLLLLHQAPDAALGRSESVRRVQEYGTAARSLGDGILDGAKLRAGGRRLSAAAATLSDSLEAGDSADVVAGYFLIGAESEERANEIAATCPHLDYGGWIELREVILPGDDPIG